MKKMNKLLALVLAMVMVLGLAASAFADEAATPTTYTITAPDNGHTYEVYQIFTGDLHKGVLSNVKWGKNGTGTQGEAVTETILTKLAGTTGSDTEKLAVISNYVTLDAENKFGTVTNAAPLENVPAGYYLIKDVDGSQDGKEDSYTLYIVSVVNNVDISPKAELPTFEKKLKDKNDTTGDTSEWQDSADWDIGDKVPFKLEGAVADNYDAYKTYYFAFHDKEEAGLTFDPTSVKVFVDGTQITTGYVVKTGENCECDEGCTFEVIFDDLKQISSVTKDSVIRVEYESTLNENAVLGEQGNVNQAKLEFSNNPNQTQGGTPETGKTPWDNVIVFTYQVVINKIDGNKESLKGAEFTLEKVLQDGTTKTIDVVKAENGSTFTFKGLDDGKYILTETVTPDGYNTVAPMTFTVNAEHAISWDGTNRTSVLTELNGNRVSGEITLEATKADGTVSSDVMNLAGATLPSTGGIGTTIFYVLGGMLVVCAVVLMVSKKRMSAEG